MRVDAEARQREDGLRGGDTGTAVRPDRLPSVDDLTERGRVAKGRVDSAGNAAGDCVDRLALAPVSLRSAGIEEDARPRDRRGAFGIEHRQRSRSYDDVAVRRSRQRGVDLTARPDPRRPAAVE